MSKTCMHLEALEQAMLAQGVALGDPKPSPYGERPGETWYWVDAGFDEPALRSRLHLADCVDFTEYDGRVAGSDATFYCTACKIAVMGIHPNYLRAGLKRIS